jgi:CheY-like chemotaxis protein
VRYASGSPDPLILVVDDFEDTRVLYAEALVEAGFRVDQAATGREAIESARSQPPDAILMDLHMPNVDGWDATRAIRATNGARPYIVAVSAHFSESSKQEAFDAGCDDFVAKPVLPDLMVTIVRGALRARA